MTVALRLFDRNDNFTSHCSYRNFFPLIDLPFTTLIPGARVICLCRLVTARGLAGLDGEAGGALRFPLLFGSGTVRRPHCVQRGGRLLPNSPRLARQGALSLICLQGRHAGSQLRINRVFTTPQG